MTWTRRRLLTGMAVTAAGCAQPGVPQLKRFYRQLGPSAGQPPLVVIPGAFGSRLRSRATGREIWPGSDASLLFSNYESIEMDIDPETLEPVSGDVEAYDIFREGVGRDFYGRMLRALEKFGGYQRLHPGQVPTADGRYYYVFPYDWRQDNVAAVGRLHQLIERITEDHRDPKLKVDIVGHSNGGLLARYYARYGTTDVLGGPPFDPIGTGSRRIRRLLLVGSPNLGTLQPVLAQIRGEEVGLRNIPPDIVATCPGEPQLMPHPQIPWLYDLRGEPVPLAVHDPETWQTLKWSIYSDLARERIIRRHGGGRDGRRHLAILEAYFAKFLARGRRFQEAMARESSAEEPAPHVFGGDCSPTVARVVLEHHGGLAHARENAASIRNPVPGVDYDALINDPGDGVVTRGSLLGRLPAENVPPLKIAHSVFLCEGHQQLTGNLSFQVNLLHTLLSAETA